MSFDCPYKDHNTYMCLNRAVLGEANSLRLGRLCRWVRRLCVSLSGEAKHAAGNIEHPPDCTQKHVLPSACRLLCLKLMTRKTAPCWSVRKSTGAVAFTIQSLWRCQGGVRNMVARQAQGRDKVTRQSAASMELKA
jgi:hypothetical protein